MFDAVGGGDVAARTVARWSGRALDPGRLGLPEAAARARGGGRRGQRGPGRVHARSRPDETPWPRRWPPRPGWSGPPGRLEADRAGPHPCNGQGRDPPDGRGAPVQPPLARSVAPGRAASTRRPAPGVVAPTSTAACPHAARFSHPPRHGRCTAPPSPADAPVSLDRPWSRPRPTTVHSGLRHARGRLTRRPSSAASRTTGASARTGAWCSAVGSSSGTAITTRCSKPEMRTTPRPGTCPSPSPARNVSSSAHQHPDHHRRAERRDRQAAIPGVRPR